MWNEIAAWQEKLAHRPDLSAKSIALYTQDARRFATWLQNEHPGLKATEITPIDAKTYRDHLLAKRFAPTTINRALISLMLFFDTLDGSNPFRNLTMIEVVEPCTRRPLKDRMERGPALRRATHSPRSRTGVGSGYPLPLCWPPRLGSRSPSDS